MELKNSSVIPVGQKLFLAMMGFVAFSIILFATNSYGAGLSPDSVNYISVARSIVNGAGFVQFSGSPMVVWPPLYPMILATVEHIFGVDPLSSAAFINAILFGLIVYLSGLLALKYLPAFPSFAMLGTLAIVFSIPLFEVSTMTWSEPLFICFVLLSFVFACSYLETNRLLTLVLFSLSVALSTLVRYIGVTVILWGVLTILISHRGSLKNKTGHFLLFILLSTLPLSLWLIRNYIISNTLFGSRSLSTYTVFENLSLMFTQLFYWYIPHKVIEDPSILVIATLGIGLFAILSLRAGMKMNLGRASSLILFTIIYLVFVIISSTTTAYDPINNRLLAPIFVPLTLLLLISVQAIVSPHRKRFSKKLVDFLLLIGLMIGLLYPVYITTANAKMMNSIGQGYSGKVWRESETVQYLLHHQALESECTLYTNGPDIVYILMDIIAKPIPNKTRSHVSDLSNSWPEESDVCLVWFNKIERTYLFTVDELQAIANIDLITHLEDGAIYSIARKQ